MKKIFFVLIIFLSAFSILLADYKLEPTNCTVNKKDNCGAYLYNVKTGSTYFCTSEKCTEILEALEEISEEESEQNTTVNKESKKSKIPKFDQNKEKKESKIPKFKKSN